MLRSEVADVWNVFKSPAADAMPDVAAVMALPYTAALFAAASTVCR